MARWLAYLASLLLGARVVVDGLRLRGELRYHELFERSFRQPRRVARVMAEVESELVLLGQIADGLLLATAFAFIGWLFVRYRALDDRRRTPGWALWSWLVPGLNLVEPYRIAREVHAGGSRGATDRAPWLVFGWWSSWLLYLVLLIGVIAAEGRATAYLRAGEPLKAFEQSLLGARLGVAVAAASLGAAVLAMAVVLTIERRVSARG